jgi:hypothetical protein
LSRAKIKVTEDGVKNWSARTVSSDASGKVDRIIILRHQRDSPNQSIHATCAGGIFIVIWLINTYHIRRPEQM